jgi:hypothetical protein
MASVEEHRKAILHCQMVNVEYMRLPAGHIDGYRNLVNLYQRIAKQGLECALAWNQDYPCPYHEPAVDAFFWAVTSWAEAFGASIGADPLEWDKIIVQPHTLFASYLKPGAVVPRLPIVSGPPADVILRLDALWMGQVVKLTGSWGLIHHMKDMPAVMEARHLDEALKKPGSPSYVAYLESDLGFFMEFFRDFTFSVATRTRLETFLAAARVALEPYEGGEDDD